MSFDSERSSEDSPEIIEESHPEAAEALRALQMYHESPQHEAYQGGVPTNDAFIVGQAEGYTDDEDLDSGIHRDYDSESESESESDASHGHPPTGPTEPPQEDIIQDPPAAMHADEYASQEHHKTEIGQGNFSAQDHPTQESSQGQEMFQTEEGLQTQGSLPTQSQQSQPQEAPSFSVSHADLPSQIWVNQDQDSKRSELITPESFHSLERDLHELENAHRQTQRQLHQALLQADAARAAQERQAVLAAIDSKELGSLRSASLREKSELNSRIAEYQASADAARAEADAKTSAFAALRERFNAQSAALAEARAQLVDLQKTSAAAETQTAQAKRQEERALKQIEQLRDELGNALDEAAQFRAELDVQTSVLADVRAEARREALDALSEDVGATRGDEGVWRKQYVALRHQMDAVAAEFEQREPEILALQTAYELAEERLAAADAAVQDERKQKDELARKLRTTERRATDLQVQQQLSESTLSDLRRQLLVLLTEKLIGTSRISPDEEDELMRLREEVARADSHAEASRDDNHPMMGQAVITERLLLFKDVAELQFQNEALLRACRELAAQLDPTGDATAAALAAAQHNASEDILAASEALESLQTRYKQLREEHSTAIENEQKATTELRGNLEKISELKEQVADLQQQLLAAKRRFTESTPVELATPQNNEIERLLRIQLGHAEEKLRDVQVEFAQLRDEHKSLASQFASAQLALGRAEERGSGAASRAASLEASLANAKHELAVLTQEKQLWVNRENELLAQIAGIQTDLETAERTAGKGRFAQDELQAQLLEQVKKIEALVASNGLPNSNNTANGLADLEQKASEAEERAETLASELRSLNHTLASSKAEHSAQLQAIIESKDALESELRAQIQTLRTNLAQQKEVTERQTQSAKARDEELVEQVNDLEDKLTEARLKAEELENSTEQVKAQLTDALTSKLTTEITQKLRGDLTHEITESLTQQIREGVEHEIREELAHKIKEELAPIIREEVTQELDGHESNPPLDAEEIKADMREKLRPEIEAALRAELAPKVLADARSQGSANELSAVDVESDQLEKQLDVEALRESLAALVPSEMLESFETALLSTEQQRVKEAFKTKLAEVRTEAQIRGEEVATKRAEIRTKLQNQKVLKLEQSNKDLQAQVDELRNKVRRLKGGSSADEDRPDSSSSFSQQWAGQDHNATQNSSISGSTSQGERSFTQWPTLAPDVNPFAPSNAFFGSAFGDTAKRPGSFEDTEAKKRKEE